MVVPILTIYFYKFLPISINFDKRIKLYIKQGTRITLKLKIMTSGIMPHALEITAQKSRMATRYLKNFVFRE